jgi:hypothetical protein
VKFTKRNIQKSDGNGGSYLSLKDGESVTVVFRGEIHEFWQSWPYGGEKLVFDKPTAGASSRFKANVVIRENNKFIAKVWEFGLAIYVQLGEINEVYPLERTKLKITRRGADKKTSYMLLPIVAEPLSGQLMAEVEAVPLNILDGKSEPEKEASDEFGF